MGKTTINCNFQYLCNKFPEATAWCTSFYLAWDLHSIPKVRSIVFRGAGRLAALAGQSVGSMWKLQRPQWRPRYRASCWWMSHLQCCRSDLVLFLWAWRCTYQAVYLDGERRFDLNRPCTEIVAINMKSVFTPGTWQLSYIHTQYYMYIYLFI